MMGGGGFYYVKIGRLNHLQGHGQNNELISLFLALTNCRISYLPLPVTGGLYTSSDSK